MNISKLLTIILALFLAMLFQPGQSWAQEQNDLLTEVLSAHVLGNRIDYTNLCKDERLNRYTDQLNATDPQAIPQPQDLFAFWMNVYNAYSLKAICKQYPIKSVNDLNFGGLIISVLLKKSVWDKPFVMVNHKPHTLREVDHEILRPTFKDPRIQFAISCGAVGCAPSRKEAYEGNKIDQQLDDQARRFINDPKLNVFDKEHMTAKISTLFNWSKKDFGGNDHELLLYLSKYLPDDIKMSIVASVSSWKITYNNYDLTLNDAKN